MQLLDSKSASEGRWLKSLPADCRDTIGSAWRRIVHRLRKGGRHSPDAQSASRDSTPDLYLLYRVPGATIIWLERRPDSHHSWYSHCSLTPGS